MRALSDFTVTRKVKMIEPPARRGQRGIESMETSRTAVPQREGVEETVARLAREAGFSLSGIAAVPEPGEGPAALEGFAARFSEWVEEGCAAEMEYLKRRDEENRLLRSSLRVALPWARSVIVCAANYNAGRAKSMDPSSEGSGWISRYAWTGYRKEEERGGLPDSHRMDAAAPEPLRPSDYHTVLLARLKRMEIALKESMGPFESRSYVDTGPVAERVYARQAGLGWTGKNTCLINQEMGSWLFLGVIVTALELPPSRASIPNGGWFDQNHLAPDRCGSCTRCIDACPTGALVAPRQLDARLCISYLTIEKRGGIPEPLRAQIGRQVFGCDICQEVCPWNRKAPRSTDPELALREELVNPALEWLAELDAEGFRRLFKYSPLSRTKLRGLLRNVAIAMGNSGLRRYLPRLEKWAADDSDPVLAEAAQWAIGRLREASEAITELTPEPASPQAY